MHTSKIIQIGKEIIYIAGYYKKYEPKDKIKILNRLQGYKKQLVGSDNKYALRLINFIDDLINDLEANRNLQIDEIFEDDLVGNYYYTKKQVKNYNNLINNDLYNKIKYNDSKISIKDIDELTNQFKKNFLLLDTKLLSENLLIFTSFELEPIYSKLIRLYINTAYNNNIKKLILIYNSFTKDIKKRAITNLKNGNIHYKYIKIKSDKENGGEFSFEIHDTSTYQYRNNNPIYEYTQIIRSLKS